MHHLNPEFQPMNALAPYLLALHQQDLLAEAEVARRVKLASSIDRSVPAWRRSLAGLLASAARSIDPSRGGGHMARHAA